MAALEASKALSGVNTQSLTDDTESTSATNVNAAAAVGEALKGIGAIEEASVNKQTPSAASAVKVKIVEADVKFIMSEMEVSKDTATQALRRTGGSKVEALRLLVLGK